MEFADDQNHYEVEEEVEEEFEEVEEVEEVEDDGDANVEPQNNDQGVENGDGDGEGDGNGADLKSGDAAGKIFVGGVAWETTEENFTAHFKKYGEITDSVIMRDKHTQMPRGFGFVTFANPSVIDKVLEDEHIIDGRTVEVKRTVPREEMPSKSGGKTKKIFVGGIPTSLTEDELKEHFSSYGAVVEHQIMLDHSTGRSRGFGFVTFEKEDAVDKLISEGRMHDLNGKQVEIKRAEPKRPGGDSGTNGRASRGSSSGSQRGYRGNDNYGYGGGYNRSGGEYPSYGGSAGYGYGRGYAAAYGGYPAYGAGYGPSYGGPMYGGAGYGGTGGGYGGAGAGAGGYGGAGAAGYGSFYGGYGSGRGYGNRYHPYGK